MRPTFGGSHVTVLLFRGGHRESPRDRVSRTSVPWDTVTTGGGGGRLRGGTRGPCSSDAQPRPRPPSLPHHALHGPGWERNLEEQRGERPAAGRPWRFPAPTWEPIHNGRKLTKSVELNSPLLWFLGVFFFCFVLCLYSDTVTQKMGGEAL